MKKLLALVLVISLLLLGAFFAYALAEAADTTPSSAPLVNLTGVVVAFVLAGFDFLLAWIAKVIVPPIKQWLNTHTTEKQKGLLWDAITELVDAAEQIITGPGMGERRMAYVEAGLAQRGFTVDRDLIEAAVRRMKQNTRIIFADAFGAEVNVEPDGCGEKDYCELDDDGNEIKPDPPEAPQSPIE